MFSVFRMMLFCTSFAVAFAETVIVSLSAKKIVCHAKLIRQDYLNIYRIFHCNFVTVP